MCITALTEAEQIKAARQLIADGYSITHYTKYLIMFTKSGEEPAYIALI